MSGAPYVAHPRHESISPSSTSSLIAATPFLKSMSRVTAQPALHQKHRTLRDRARGTLPSKTRSAAQSLMRSTPPVAHPYFQFSLSPDPRNWGSNLSPDFTEADDDIHNPDHGINSRSIFHDGHLLSYRGLANMGCLVLLILGIITLFSGQVPEMPGNWGLIDLDTPQEAYTRVSFYDSSELELVFSDEFNTDGRTFYPGDDPYWEAVDLHYWETNNLEWYDPAAITTKNGALTITLSQKETHDLNFQGGMMTTWNKFCFTGGYIETSVKLPGSNNIVGLWPAVWTMGNLGRAGYGASLEGMWPYTYDACDVGTVANQTVNGSPEAATVNGDASENGILSFLPGQRLSRCTCNGESHPGPKHSDGTYVGRSAPEIDIFEAQITGTPLTGQVSQSAQWAPFNHGYEWFNTTANEIIADTTISEQNSYIGGSTQQATSVVTNTDQLCYENSATPCFSVYGFEYKGGFDNAYITWVSDNKTAWTLNVAGMAADSLVEISGRPVPQEPMYIIANLGMSENFGTVDLTHLVFPATMYIDYIRVYQPKNARNIGCDPTDFPTEAYINQYMEAYTNPNLTTWVNDFKQTFPKNSFLGQC
ncbi:hypothetical protein EW146_g6466 [Bondarzewia mesenterica]|uniref:GH16 domain-containing protein n=1 Tax=Bondarzewia mesenterica TaxID=1095465 RepID=A0A4S4LQI7_9AGAM|nr:hypothetical protein EW146_g6466 [Bondarzewia mesenterica]